jgi:hypothetical protein
MTWSKLLAVMVVCGCSGTIVQTSAGAGDARPAVDAKPGTGGIDARPSGIDARPPGIDAPPANGPPRLGGHGLAFHRLQGGVAGISTPAMSTQTGSTIVVATARGDKATIVPPTDNKGNASYFRVGDVEPYSCCPRAGTAVYAMNAAQGGGGHVVSTQIDDYDEITLAAVEVVNGRRIQDFKWNEILAPNATRTLAVTTTGPATLIAVWWGDGPEPDQKIATPDSGFTVIESIGDPGALIQCFVAVREVGAAGSYDVTWTSTPVQGAQMWLIAVQ